MMMMMMMMMTIPKEYCDGGSLGDYVLRRRGLDAREIAATCQQVLRGLEFLHARDIVHRDIKAGNLLLCKRGRIKLADFGLAQVVVVGGSVGGGGGDGVQLQPQPHQQMHPAASSSWSSLLPPPPSQPLEIPASPYWWVDCWRRRGMFHSLTLSLSLSLSSLLIALLARCYTSREILHPSIHLGWPRKR